MAYINVHLPRRGLHWLATNQEDVEMIDDAEGESPLPATPSTPRHRTSP